MSDGLDGTSRVSVNGQCPGGDSPLLIPQANDPPTDIALNNASVPENSATGTLVGMLTATDPDVGDTFTFSLLDDAGGRFQIVGDQLQVANGALLDFEADTSHAVTIQVTDNHGGTYSELFTITVTDVNEAPTAVDNAYTTAEDTLLDSTTLGADQSVLDNDSDPENDALTVAAVNGSAANVGTLLALTNGTLTMQADGTFTYAPNLDATSPPDDTFTYTVCDPEPLCDTATVTITINPVDDPSVAVADSATVAEDASATAIDVLANDTDVDGGPISIQSVTQPANGTVVITGGGTGLTYTPDPDYCNDGTPTDDFTYTLNGGSSATVAVTVTCQDDPPTAVADVATVAEDASATAIDVLANDTDVDGGPISIQSVTQPANGTVVITNGGADLTYAPDPDYCNDGTPTDDFTYTLNGGSTATVSVTVTCVDDAPVAVSDAATVGEDAGATALDVLANDTDVDAGPLSIQSVTQPTNGTVVITGGGTGLTYQPNPDYCNDPPGTTPDTFTYTLTPGGSTATVSVTVTCVDDVPVAVADAATVAEDSGANAIDVLANDTDVDGGLKQIQSVTQPTNGTVAITGGGTGLSYTPDPDYCNDGTPTDDFTYTLNGGSSTTVAVTVTCVDDPPTAVNDTATVTEDSGANAIDVLANDTDTDGGPKLVQSVTQPANGAAAITGGGTGLSYTPNLNYCNDGTPTDDFTYTLNGGSTATVSVTVTCVNDPPAIDLDVDDSGGTGGADFAVSYTENAGGVPIVDTADATITDVDSTTLVSLIVTITNLQDAGQEFLEANPTGFPNITVSYVSATGVLTISSVTPQPIADYVAVLRTVTYEHSGDDPTGGPRSITFVANDGTDDSIPVTSTVTVIPVNDAPVLDDASFNLDENSPNGMVVGTVTGSDIENDTLTYSITAGNGSGGGAFAIDASTGQITVNDSAQLDFETTPSFSLTVQVTDNGVPSASDTATVTITLNDVNEAPLAVQDDYDAYTNTELAAGGATITGLAGITNATDALANDSDPDTNPLFNVITIDAASGTSANNGSFSIAADGSFTYTPAAGFTGVDTFTYTLRDNGPSGGLTATGTVQLTVAGTAVWYLDTAETTNGTGTSTSPFNVINAATLNGGSDVDAANEIIYAATGGANSGALGLEAGQRLIGEGVDLVVQFLATPTTIATAGTRPVMGTLTLATNNTVRGLNVDAATGITGADVDTLILNSVGITSTSGSALNIAGGTAGMNVQIDSLVANSGANPGVQATNNAMGTLVISGATNTITSTTGTALNVANTTIGAGGLTFQSISANGAANGIILNTTGSTAGLTVTGTGTTDGSGGTIQNTQNSTGAGVPTGVGVLLTSTSNVNLTNLNIQGSGNDGLRGTSVNNLTLNNCNLTNNGNETAENGLQLGEATGSIVGITGTLTLTDTNITGSAGNNVHIRNTSGTLASMTVTGGSFNDLNDVTGANSFLFEMSGTAVTTAATISGATFSNNSPQRALEVQVHEDGTISDFTVSGSTFNENGIHASFTQDTTGDLTFSMLNNTSMLNANPLHAINVFSSSTSTGGSITGTISGNVIGNAATANSGARGNGIRALIQGRTTAVLRIHGNTLRQIWDPASGARGIDLQFLGPTAGGQPITQSDVTVTNNDVDTMAPASSFPLAAIFVGADDQGSPARVRADITGNTAVNSVGGGSFDYPTFDGNGAHLIFIEVGGAAEDQLVDTPPASADAATQLTSTNTGTVFTQGITLIPGPINTPS